MPRFNQQNSTLNGFFIAVAGLVVIIFYLLFQPEQPDTYTPISGGQVVIPLSPDEGGAGMQKPSDIQGGILQQPGSIWSPQQPLTVRPGDLNNVGEIKPAPQASPSPGL